MTDLLKSLCMIDGTSGDENSVSDFIIQQINYQLYNHNDI